MEIEYRSNFSPEELKEYFNQCGRLRNAEAAASQARFRAHVAGAKTREEYAARAAEFRQMLQAKETKTQHTIQEAPLMATTDRPDKEIVRRTMAMVKSEGIDFRTAMERVLKDDPSLAAAYKNSFTV